ncbi:MAG: leucine-rich repeat domain-containing protein [Bacilli bacterium]|nr:leucine-rich repeat domain-containing protein [Bacilli bacterium]
MNEEKKKRNKIIGISIGILVVLLVVISSTYAYWQITKSQNGSNDIIAACLSIDMQSVDGTFGLNPAWPISDTEGMNLTGYKFRVTNKCPEDVTYVIGMDSLEVSGAKYLSYDSIKVSIDDSIPMIYGIQEDIDHIAEEDDNYVIRDSKKIATAVVKNGQPNEHIVKVWIKSDAPVEEQSKVFSGRMFITGGQNIKNDKPLAQVIATGDISKTSNDHVTYSLYSDGRLNIEGVGEMKDFVEDVDSKPFYIDMVKSYTTQNNITLTEEELALLESGELPLGIMFTKSDEITSEFFGVTYEGLMTMLSQEIGAAGISLVQKLTDFPGILNVKISEGVTSIGISTFDSLAINGIIIPNTVTSLGKEAFSTAYIINELVIPNSVVNVGGFLFSGAVIKSPLRLPESINSISTAMFSNAKVKSLELPHNEALTSVGVRAMQNMSIEELIIPENIVEFGSDVFDGTDFTNTTLKLYGSERTIEGLDLTQFKEVIWNYTGE